MNSPLKQFVIQKIFPIHWAGYDLSVTNSTIFMLIALGFSMFIFTRSIVRGTLVPGRLQVVAEGLISTILQLMKDNVAPEGRQYFPLIFSAFIFILFGNLLGLIPGAFTVTSHIVVTLAFGFMIFFLITIIGFMRHGLGFFRKFIPSGVPAPIMPIIVAVELISFCFRPFSLGVRLFANMLAGHVVLSIFAGFTVSMGVLGFMPLLTNVLFIGFEVFVSGLQAYIFTVLSCSYLNDVLHLEH